MAELRGMKLTGFFSVVVGLALAVAILAVGNFVFHIPEGLGRLALFALAAIVFLVLAFGPGNLWGKPTPTPTYTTEAEASADLAIAQYAGKWSRAKDYVTANKPTTSPQQYWEAVREYYLSVGGLRKNQVVTL